MTYLPKVPLPFSFTATQTDESAGTYAEAASLTFTPYLPGTNNWAIGFKAMATAPAGHSAVTKIEIDGVTCCDGAKSEDQGDWIIASGHGFRALDKSAHTIKVYVKTSQAGQQASLKEILIKAFPQLA